MRLLATIAVFFAVAAPMRPAVVAETSDLLVHSPLAACPANSAAAASGSRHARIASWNIRAAQGSSLAAIAAELRKMRADVIALQEVDVRVRRTGFVDEPAALASALGFQYVFAASIKWDEGDYGLAVLSRWPLADVRRARLDATGASEPRIVLETTVCDAGRPLRLFNHHADGRAVSREAGFASLRALVQPEIGHGVLVLGDFNERPDGAGVRSLLDAGLVDLGAAGNVDTAGDGRIDYLLADGPLSPRSSTARVWTTELSDHNALLTDLEW